MTKLRRTITFAILALATPYLYDRYIAFSTIVANRPGALEEVNTFKSLEIKFQDRIRNCEDVILEEKLGIALLACDPGRDQWNTVMVGPLTPLTSTNFPTSRDFHPLGIEFDSATSTLYVINHSRSGFVIEIFHVAFEEKTARHVKTFKHDLPHAPNAMQLLGEGRMYVTNDHYIRAAVSPLLSKIETFSGIPGGTVVYVDLEKPEQSKVVAHVPFANGVTRLNETTLAVASSSKSGVYFYSIQNDFALVYMKYFRTPASADNLSIDSDNNLLIAGHPFAPDLMEVAAGRADCDPDGEKDSCACFAGVWVGQWSEEGGLKTLLRSSGKGVRWRV